MPATTNNDGAYAVPGELEFADVGFANGEAPKGLALGASAFGTPTLRSNGGSLQAAMLD